MKIDYNVTGAERKALVAAISEITGVQAKYLRVPSCAYQIGAYHVSKEGTVTWDENIKDGTAAYLMRELAKKGFTAANAKEFEGIDAVADSFTLAQETPQEETSGLTVTLPRSKVNPDNLKKIIASKSGLIKSALGIDALPVNVTQSTVSFPWFSELPTSEECTAYMDFITALCRMSMEQKRVTASNRIVENEKYAFRCFLLRLGFIGAEYKKDRKILLSRLTGNAAWKGGAKDAE